MGTADKSVNKVKRDHVAKKQYENLKKLKGENVYAYKERFIATLTKLEVLEIARPSDNEQAIVFIEGLDDAKFSSWKVEIANNQLRGIDIYSKTLNDAAVQAANMKVTAVSNYDINEQPIVYLTNADKNRNNNNNNKFNKETIKIMANNMIIHQN